MNDKQTKRKNSSAYEDALHYFQTAFPYWQMICGKEIFLLLSLSLARAEAEYLILHVNEADQLLMAGDEGTQ
jgi:hypothetical protein